MFGKMGGFGDWSFNRIENPKVSFMESSSSSSGATKTAKAPGNSTHVVSCLVDGCNSDLSLCREYHRRHKVCEVHSKTARVTIRGQEQRFCQQCSRFHSLVEFDEGKRSCRKRLEGHNRRRRKPQSESLSRNTGRFLSNQQGTMLSFSSPSLVPSAMVNSAVPYNSHHCLNILQGKILQGNDLPLPEASSRSSRQHLIDPNPASEKSCHSRKMFLDGLSRATDSDCALSLLSSAPAGTGEIGLSHHAVIPNPVTPAQSLAHNVHYNDLCKYSQEIESKPVVSILSSHVGNTATLHCQEMFQNGPEGSSASGSHQTLSFRWD